MFKEKKELSNRVIKKTGDVKRKSIGKGLSRILALVLSVVMIYCMGIMSYADDNYAALSQYYTVLALQGGNSEISAEQAMQLAQYYAVLAGSGDSGATQTPSAPQTPSVQGGGTQISVVNVNASDTFYQEAYAIVNGMPEYIKQKLKDLDVVYYCYHSGADYGADYNTGGLTSGYQTVTNGRIRTLQLHVDLSEYKNRMSTISVVYHETGHVIDQLIWKQTGRLASETSAFAQSTNGEIQSLKGIFGYNHSNYNSSEWFADAFANYYLNNGVFASRCPKLYYYMSTLTY